MIKFQVKIVYHNKYYIKKAFLIDNINLFGKRGGFNLILERIKNKNSKPSLYIISMMLKPIVKVNFKDIMII